MSTSSANVKQSDGSGSDFLNEMGNFILAIDYRWVIIFSVLFLSVLFIARYKMNSEKPNLEAVLQSLLSMLMIYTGILTASAFLLISPPAVNKLSNLELATIGLISLVTFVSFGLQQLTGLFSNIRYKKQKSSKSQAEENRVTHDDEGKP